MNENEIEVQCPICFGTGRKSYCDLDLEMRGSFECLCCLGKCKIIRQMTFEERFYRLEALFLKAFKEGFPWKNITP